MRLSWIKRLTRSRIRVNSETIRNGAKKKLEFQARGNAEALNFHIELVRPARLSPVSESPGSRSKSTKLPETLAPDVFLRESVIGGGVIIVRFKCQRSYTFSRYLCRYASPRRRFTTCLSLSLSLCLPLSFCYDITFYVPFACTILSPYELSFLFIFFFFFFSFLSSN